MDMEEETADGGLFFRTKNDTQRLCDLHAAFYIILYWRNEKMIISVLKLPFITYFW